jgi:hypothetical protein
MSWMLSTQSCMGIYSGGVRSFMVGCFELIQENFRNHGRMHAIPLIRLALLA